MEEESRLRTSLEVECTFFDFKRIISETVLAITDSRISLEMFLKTMSFNFYMDLRAQALKKTSNKVVVKGN